MGGSTDGRQVSASGAPPLRFDRGEIGGALGDLGTFIPLLVGMVTLCGLQIGPALFCAGLMNVVSGVLFRIPMPVQPMKAIATVAIGEGLTEAQILAAGIITGGVVLVLGVSGLVTRLAQAVPRSVVRGLQLALGLKLLTAGIGMVAETGTLWGWDSVAVGALCVVLVLMFYFSRRVPAALVIFGVGLVALLASQPQLVVAARTGMAWALPDLSRGGDWLTGLWRGAVPQVPLTLLNSVVAVCALSADLFPRWPASPRRVAISVGLMNLVSCPVGGMPMCHGAGGLAGQYRFGARTGGSVIVLGVAKMLLAVLLGRSLLEWLRAYPQSVLGVLLMFSGLELALVCRDQRSRTDFFVMLLTAGICLGINTAAGAAIGWVLAVLLVHGVFRIEPPPSEAEEAAQPSVTGATGGGDAPGLRRCSREQGSGGSTRRESPP